MTLRALILARIDAIGPAEVARRVAPAWGWSSRDAETRISRWRALDKGPDKGKDMSSTALLALLEALDLTITPKAP